MRVDRRVAQAPGDQLLELLREHVLEHLGLGVHAIPGHPELLGEKQLEQPVMAQHLQRDPPTLVGQPHTVIGLVLERAPPRRACAASPDTDPGVTPRRAARSFVDTGEPPRASSAYTALA